MIESSQIVAVISWVLLLIFFHLALYPWIKDYLPEIAVPVSWTGGFILTTLATWYAVLCGLSARIGIIPVLIICICTCYYKKTGFYCQIPLEWRYYLLFSLVFGAMLIVRAYNPDINGAEKFMDHGFLASILRSPLVPPLDPWFAGGFLNVYYYLGHWMIATPALMAGIPSYILFNLALPTVAALSAINIYGVGHLVLKRTRLLPVLAFFIVNPYFIYLALSGTRSFTLLWDSSRVIENTINEYPLFSFLFGDVHAHVLGILPQTFLVLMVTAALTYWTNSNKSRLTILLFTALGLSIVPAVNSWDVFIWAPMILGTGLWLISKEYHIFYHLTHPKAIILRLLTVIKEKDFSQALDPGPVAFFYLLLVPAASLILISPLLFGMQSPGIEGFGFVHAPSTLQQFLLVNGWFFIGFIFSLRTQMMKVPWIIVAIIPFFLTGYISAGLAGLFLVLVLHRRSGPADLLAAGGLAILLFCELIYLVDNMGEVYYRMNTVFKLYIGAWILCGTAAALMVGRECDIYFSVHPGLKSRILQYTVVIMLILCLIIPPVIVSTIHGSHTPTLDGMAWLKGTHQGDAEAITFLRTLPGSHILVEATGDDYQYTSRVSSFTGVPTIIGWQFHEYMWRGDNPKGWYGQRSKDIQTIYEDPDQTIRLMNQYKADLLYVGPVEHEKYAVLLPLEGLQELYRNRDVTIYHHTLS